MIFYKSGRRLYTKGPNRQVRSAAQVSVPTFLKSAAAPRDFPSDTGLEVAFVGRSNSGKSTALNALLGARKLARVSKTPGRTQLVNFFDVGRDRRVVDLPGYGFARVPAQVRDRWRGLLEAYFDARRSLVGLVVTVDIRRGLAAMDYQMLEWVAPLELEVAVLLTKADKLSRTRAIAAERAAAQELASVVWLRRFSAIDGAGVADARAWLGDRLADSEKK